MSNITDDKLRMEHIRCTDCSDLILLHQIDLGKSWEELKEKPDPKITCMVDGCDCEMKLPLQRPIFWMVDDGDGGSRIWRNNDSIRRRNIGK